MPPLPAAGTNVPAKWMKPTLKCCGRSWQQRAAGKYLQIYKCGLESPEVPLSVGRVKQNQVKVIMHGLAWSEAPLLCKRKSTKVIVSGVVLAFWIFCSSRSIWPTT
ncbi:uncharacterized protein [Procambarus clarkii]|uniref:uncharacterized protein isoform X1 n=1 Tax=Procambarus clarkii TaxID=6728 RepID=UPI00374242A0